MDAGRAVDTNGYEGIDEPLSPERQFTLLYEEGKTDGEIARIALGDGKQYTKVRSWRKRCGYPDNAKKKTPAKIDTAFDREADKLIAEVRKEKDSKCACAEKKRDTLPDMRIRIISPQKEQGPGLTEGIIKLIETAEMVKSMDPYARRLMERLMVLLAKWEG